jgi:hypothetical protein
MNDLKRKDIFDSIREIQAKIARVDENLAGLFGRIAEEIALKGERKQNGGILYPINSKGADDTLRDIGYGKEINTIPFGEPTNNCYEDCVAIAFGLLNSKYGFNKIAEKIKDHWLACKEINCRTLIITNAWDSYDFYRRYKETFDIYCSSVSRKNVKHTIVIILYGNYGFSLQYLK